jgi:hypothetical protein
LKEYKVFSRSDHILEGLSGETEAYEQQQQQQQQQRGALEQQQQQQQQQQLGSVRRSGLLPTASRTMWTNS